MMNQAARFWDWMANRYAKQPVPDEVTYQKKLKVTQEYLRPDMLVLEFGCGTGSTALIHAPYVQQIQAIDISSKMIEIAQSKAAVQNIGNVSFKCATLDNLGVSDQTFDAVFGLNVLHLVPDKEDAIARVHKLLKPGGVFVSSTACVRDMSILFRIIAPVCNLLPLLPLVSIFTVNELEGSLTRAGFVIEHQWLPGRNKAVFIVAKKPA